MCAVHPYLSGFLASIVTSPYSVAVVTVLVTVGFSHIVQRRKETINTLRAIRTEVENNKDIGAAQLSFIDESFSLDDPMDELQAYTRKFSTRSFDRAVESGAVWRLPEKDRERLLKHYDFIKDANTVLDHRQQIFFAKYSTRDKGALERVISGSDDNFADIRVNALALKVFYPLLPQEFTNIKNIDTFLQLHNYATPDETLDDMDIAPTYIDFETVKFEIEDQIDGLNPMNVL